MDNNGDYPINDLPLNATQSGTSQQKPGRVLPLPFVLAGGIFTSLLVLYGNYLYSLRYEENILSWLGGPYIPYGAILVGCFAGCGYGLFARVLQFFPTKNFILSMIFVQFALFFVGRYLEYRQVTFYLPNPSSFFQVYTNQIENVQWIGNEPLAKPFTMGKWGYMIEFFTGTMFSLTSLVSLVVLWGIPYCKQCRLFMRKKVEVILPASIKRTKIPKNNTAILTQHQQESELVLCETIQLASPIVDLLKANKENSAPVIEFLRSMKKKKGISTHIAEKYWYVVKIRLWQCPGCGHYSLLLVTELPYTTNLGTPRLENTPTIEYDSGKFTVLSGFPENQT